MAIFRILPVLVAALAAGAGQAQDYPSRPVRVIVPWPAGGSNDTTARVVMKAVSESIGQPVVVENKAGAAGLIGANLVAKARPDGYTLMVHSATHLANAFLYKKLPYDTLRDFTPVALLAAQPSALAVRASLPARNVGEFVKLARSRPRGLSYSSAGVASASHLPMLMLTAATGVDLLHVPYNGGNPQTMALAAQEVDASITILSTVLPHLQSGAVRLLAVTSVGRSSAVPEVPTLAEAGIKDFDFTPWIGLFAPTDTPAAIVGKLNTEVRKALDRPEVRKTLQRQALDPWPASPAEFSRRVREDSDKYAALIRATGAGLKE